MKKVLILLLAMLAIALVVYFCVYGKSIPSIEKDLAFRAQDKLNTSQMEWARVHIDGRDITLQGIAPSVEQRDAAQRLAQVEGVNVVNNQLTIGTGTQTAQTAQTANVSATATNISSTRNTETQNEDDYSLLIAKDKDGKLIVEGVMGAAMHQQVIKEVTAKMGADQVIDRINDKDVNSPKELPAIASIMLTRMTTLEDGRASLTGKHLQVSGSRPSKVAIEQVKQQTANDLPKGFTSSFSLTPPDALARFSGVNRENAASPVVAPTADDQPVADMSVKNCQQQFDKILANSKIYFNSSSATIKKSSYQTLNRLATTASQCTAYNIKVHGHTDATGRNALNQQLSKKRALAVAEYLTKKGVNPKHIRAIGHGSSQPIASNRTSEGRARNRRIELTVEN